MNDRRKLMLHGHISVGFALTAKQQIAGSPEIRMKGVPVEEDLEAFLEAAYEALLGALKTANRKADLEAIRESARLAVRRVANAWTGKKPIVDVTIVQL
jgi:ribonuclease J